MEARKIKTVSIVGAGNVASHIASRFFKNGVRVAEVWSKHAENAEELSKKIHAKVCTDLTAIQTNIDLLIVSVKDDAMQDLLNQLPPDIPAIVHTSGSIDMKLLEGKAALIGVLYPLQSFNKNEELDWTHIPICIETNGDRFTEELFGLGKRLSNDVQYINSTQRIHLHIAAVIANNFTNYLYSVSHDIAVNHHLSFSMLLPLIKQTSNRLHNTDPFLLQTGPAKRNDIQLVNKHIQLLSEQPDIAELYEFISKQIIKKAGK